MMKKTIKLQNKNKNTTKVKRYELSSPLFLESQRGVTLIEAMISLLIFSVGALGLAAMQLTAITASGDSQQRTMAIWKAQELADRIRSNPNLRQLYVAAIGNQTPDGVASPAGNDMLLYFEWVSREADANADPITGIANNEQLLNTNLCDTDVEMASSLEAYCLRFQPF